jgi:YgiT-type zinc finger domain-containing protein
MQDKRCNPCGSSQYEERKVTYLYSHQGQYLIVPNTPVEICTECGTAYYSASVLKAIEQKFLAIQNNQSTPDEYLQVPVHSL